MYNHEKFNETISAIIECSDRDPDWLQIGEDISTIPGIKVIFDGYGYNEETNDDNDINFESYAVFIHRKSLTEEFPEHDQTPWALIHRPKEEVCVYVWYDVEKEEYDVIPLEDCVAYSDEECRTNGYMTISEAVDIVQEIKNRYFGEQ